MEHLVLDEIIADLFDLDARAVPVLDMTGSNMTTDWHRRRMFEDLHERWLHYKLLS